MSPERRRRPRSTVSPSPGATVQTLKILKKTRSAVQKTTRAVTRAAPRELSRPDHQYHQDDGEGEGDRFDRSLGDGLGGMGGIDPRQSGHPHGIDGRRRGHDDGHHHRHQGGHVDPAETVGGGDPAGLAEATVEDMVDPVGQQHGQGQVGESDVPALQPLASEEGHVDEEVTEGCEAPQGQDDADHGDQVPDQPVGPATAPVMVPSRAKAAANGSRPT